MKHKIILALLLPLLLLTSCNIIAYKDEFNYIQDNVTNQEYKIGDKEAFDKISKDSNYEFEDYVSYKLFRSKDDLNYYYFNNENKLYRFLTYDPKSSILDYQIGTNNKEKFYANMNLDNKKANYDSEIAAGHPTEDDLFLPMTNSQIIDVDWWNNYFYKGNLIFGILDTNNVFYGFFIQYK